MFKRFASKLILKRSLHLSKKNPKIGRLGTFKEPDPLGNNIAKKVIKYGSIGAILLSATYASQVTFGEGSSVTKTFSKIHGSQHFTYSPNAVLQRALTVGPPDTNFYYVTGEKMSGTSTLVRYLASTLNQTGVVWVDLIGSTDEDIVVSLASTFGVSLEHVHRGGFFKSRQIDDLSALLEVIEKGCVTYVKKNKTQPLLIIDYFDQLATANNAAYVKLLNLASDWSRVGICRVVFVASNDKSAMFDSTVFPASMVPIRTTPLSNADMEKFIKMFGAEDTKAAENLSTLIKDIIGGHFGLGRARVENILAHQASVVAKVEKLCRDKDQRGCQLLSMVAHSPGIKSSEVMKKGSDMEGVVRRLIVDDILAKDVANLGLYCVGRTVETVGKNVRI